MSTLAIYLRSSIGKKTLMAVSGLGMSLFALTHMAGNLLLLVGPEAYNRYSHALISNPLVVLAELGLLLFLVVHFGVAVQLTLKNRSSKDSRYAVTPENDKKTGTVARTLILSGGLLLVFTVLHLQTFKYGTYYAAVYDGEEIRDLHRLVVEVFQSPGYVVWYLISLLVLGAHLKHGVAATAQSLGLASAIHPGLKKLALGFSVVVTAGFIAIPIYCYLQGGAG